jgi:hypothetical protein
MTLPELEIWADKFQEKHFITETFQPRPFTVSLIFKIDGVGARKIKGDVASMEDADKALAEATDSNILCDFKIMKHILVKSMNP